MMSKKEKRLILITSLVTVLVLFGVVAVRLVFFRDGYGNIRPIVVNPTSAENDSEENLSQSQTNDADVHTSFIPLLPTETLMDTLTIDFDGDTFDDQVIAIRKANSPYLFLVVGLYNPNTNSYERSAEIPTEISKIRTFSYTGIDMIGNHRMELVYQGVKSNGDSVMQIFMCIKKRGFVEIQNIGNFSSDGTIFIQQTERSDAYELSQAKGASHVVWVYSSDKTEEQNSQTSGVSQVQTEFHWNEEQQKYVQTRTFRITGSRAAAKELARIQNGTVETFAKFLNGLWYKTSASVSPSYIYFDYDTKEVIFLSDDTEGVFTWEDSSLRRSGIYLTTVNSIISSMKRRFDIMLTGVNEVYVHVHDDIGLVIKESNQWDGTYKKISFQSTFGEEKKKTLDSDFLETLKKNSWIDDDGKKYVFKENEFTVVAATEQNNAAATENEIKGIFVTESVGAFPVIQMRSSSNLQFVNQSYAMKFETYEETVPAKTSRGKTTVKTFVNRDVIVLTPVALSPTTCYAVDGKMITLRKETN